MDQSEEDEDDLDDAFCWWWGSLPMVQPGCSTFGRVLRPIRVFWLERIAFCAIGGSALSALCRSGGNDVLPFLERPVPVLGIEPLIAAFISGRRGRAEPIGSMNPGVASRGSAVALRSARRSDVHHESTSRANGARYRGPSAVPGTRRPGLWITTA